MKFDGFVIAAVILSILVAGVFLLATAPMNAMPGALKALKTNGSAVVSANGWLTFEPADSTPAVGFIFYPGAKVDPRVYAPMMNEISANGFFVVVVPMSFNLAFFGIDGADGVIADHPEVKTWIIGGHSLGGAMAASYAKNRKDVRGMVFLAAYAGESDSLSDTSIRALSIYASRDGLATPRKIENTKNLLPEDTKFVEILGGNHAQFGWYGSQPGDLEATITRIRQQKIIANETVEFLESFRK